MALARLRWLWLLVILSNLDHGGDVFASASPTLKHQLLPRTDSSDTALENDDGPSLLTTHAIPSHLQRRSGNEAPWTQALTGREVDGPSVYAYAHHLQRAHKLFDKWPERNRFIKLLESRSNPGASPIHRVAFINTQKYRGNAHTFQPAEPLPPLPPGHSEPADPATQAKNFLPGRILTKNGGVREAWVQEHVLFPDHTHHLKGEVIHNPVASHRSEATSRPPKTPKARSGTQKEAPKENVDENLFASLGFRSEGKKVKKSKKGKKEHEGNPKEHQDEAIDPKSVVEAGSLHQEDDHHQSPRLDEKILPAGKQQKKKKAPPAKSLVIPKEPSTANVAPWNRKSFKDAYGEQSEHSRNPITLGRPQPQQTSSSGEHHSQKSESEVESQMRATKSLEKERHRSKTDLLQEAAISQDTSQAIPGGQMDGPSVSQTAQSSSAKRRKKKTKALQGHSTVQRDESKTTAAPALPSKERLRDSIAQSKTTQNQPVAGKDKGLDLQPESQKESMERMQQRANFGSTARQIYETGSKPLPVASKAAKAVSGQPTSSSGLPSQPIKAAPTTQTIPGQKWSSILRLRGASKPARISSPFGASTLQQEPLTNSGPARLAPQPGHENGLSGAEQTQIGGSGLLGGTHFDKQEQAIGQGRALEGSSSFNNQDLAAMPQMKDRLQLPEVKSGAVGHSSRDVDKATGQADQNFNPRSSRSARGPSKAEDSPMGRNAERLGMPDTWGSPAASSLNPSEIKRSDSVPFDATQKLQPIRIPPRQAQRRPSSIVSSDNSYRFTPSQPASGASSQTGLLDAPSHSPWSQQAADRSDTESSVSDEPEWPRGNDAHIPKKSGNFGTPLSYRPGGKPFAGKFSDPETTRAKTPTSPAPDGWRQQSNADG